jgi:hypothetical protein
VVLRPAGAVGALDSDVGRAYVELGSAAGLATTPATTLTGADGAMGFGTSSSGASD